MEEETTEYREEAEEPEEIEEDNAKEEEKTPGEEGCEFEFAAGGSGEAGDSDVDEEIAAEEDERDEYWTTCKIFFSYIFQHFTVLSLVESSRRAWFG